MEPTESELVDARTPPASNGWDEAREVRMSRELLAYRFKLQAMAVCEYYDGRRAYWRVVEPETRRSWQESRAYVEAIEWGRTREGRDG